jgi:hypothetical protein
LELLRLAESVQDQTQDLGAHAEVVNDLLQAFLDGAF